MNLYAYVKNNPLRYLDAFGVMAYSRNDNFSGWTKNISTAWDSVSNSVSDYYESQIHEVFVINSTLNALKHYYFGEGANVELGDQTKIDIMTSKRQIEAESRLIEATTTGNPMRGGMQLMLNLIHFM